MKLTGKQIIEARKFYNNHRNYVNDLLKTIHKGYPPTLTEDKNSHILTVMLLYIYLIVPLVKL